MKNKTGPEFTNTREIKSDRDYCSAVHAYAPAEQRPHDQNKLI